MKKIVTILIAVSAVGCSSIRDFMPPIKRQLIKDPVSLEANVPLTLRPRRPRHRKRDQIGIMIFPSDAKRISRAKVTTLSGTNYIITVSLHDSKGVIHQLRPYWWTPHQIYFAVKPQPPRDLVFTNIVITTSASAKFKSVVWQQAEVW